MSYVFNPFTGCLDNVGSASIFSGDYLPLSGGTIDGNLTVVGVVSSNSIIYAYGGNSDIWNSTKTTVQTNSSQWESTYTTVLANSSTWSNAVSGSAQVLIAQVFNIEGVTMPRGSVVYSYGSTGNVMSVRFASNSAEPYSSKTLGIINDPIDAGGIGYATIAGQIDKLNLGSYSEGDALWLGSAPGSFTNVKPSAPNHGVYLGVVERANNGNGLLYVKIQNGYEIDELHNVLITSVSAGQILRRNNINNLWINTNDPINWDSVYSTVNANSGTTWNNVLANAYADSKFLPLTGGSVTGSISASGILYSNNNPTVTTISTTTPGISAVSSILAVSALPATLISGVVYIVL